MFFTKKDRQKLNLLYLAISKLKIGEALPKLVEEEKITVSGGTDLSSIAEQEEEQVREQISSKLARHQIAGGIPFYEEDLFNERELEAIE